MGRHWLCPACGTVRGHEAARRSWPGVAALLACGPKTSAPHQVSGPDPVLIVADGGAHRLPAHRACQAHAAHQPFHRSWKLMDSIVEVTEAKDRGTAGPVDLIAAGGAGCGRFTVRPCETGAPG